VAADGVTVNNLLTYTYDENNNLLTAADSHGAYTMTYDAVNRMHSQQEPFGLALTFTYDATDNRTQVQDSLGGVTTSVYDAANRLTSRQFGGTGQTPLRIDLTYTARNELATQTRFSDLAGTATVGSSANTYDGTGRLINLQHRDGSGTTLTNYAYTYDLADRVVTEQISGTVQNTTSTYTYDPANELTTEQVSGTELGNPLSYTNSFSYDLNGNRTNPGYALQSPPSDNRLATDGTWNYTYDGEGNVTQKVRISDGVNWTYAYDQRNQMTSAVEKDAGNNVLQTVTFVYDVFGNRLEEDVSTGGPATVLRFAYDNGNVWADLDGTDTLQTRRLYLDGVDQIYARITASGGAAAWYLPDRLGSIRDITDAAGVIQDHRNYDSFGNVLSESNPLFGDRYQYTGREFDGATGLQYNRARFYDPTNGRWISQDPLGFEAGDANLYRYVGNNATNATDPFGEDFIAVADRRIDGVGPAITKAIAFLRGSVAGATSRIPPPFRGLIRARLNGFIGRLGSWALALGPFHYSLQYWVTCCCPPETPEDLAAFQRRTNAVKKASVELLALWNKIPMTFTFNFRSRFGLPLPILGSPSLSILVRGITVTGTLSWRGASISVTGNFVWPPLSVIYYNQDRGNRILSISPAGWTPTRVATAWGRIIAASRAYRYAEQAAAGDTAGPPPTFTGAIVNLPNSVYGMFINNGNNSNTFVRTVAVADPGIVWRELPGLHPGNWRPVPVRSINAPFPRVITILI
jgi:RHS repeat-associated protein